MDKKKIFWLGLIVVVLFGAFLLVPAIADGDGFFTPGERLSCQVEVDVSGWDSVAKTDPELGATQCKVETCSSGLSFFDPFFGLLDVEGSVGIVHAGEVQETVSFESVAGRNAEVTLETRCEPELGQVAIVLYDEEGFEIGPRKVVR